MTSKCKTCGHTKEQHTQTIVDMKYQKKQGYCMMKDCPCDKLFVPEDEKKYRTYGTDENLDHLAGIAKEKKGAVLPQLKGSVKEKNGCGKEIGTKNLTWHSCGAFCPKHREIHLCPSCNSKSVDTPNRNEADTPEEKCSSKVVSPPSGDNSPQVISRKHVNVDVKTPGDTKTLSDKWKTALANGDNILTHMYYEEDLKDSIAKLKEELCQKPYGDDCGYCFVCQKIKNIFGERLTSQEND